MEPTEGNVVGANEVAMAYLVLELLLWRMINFHLSCAQPIIQLCFIL